ncbi:AraC family transcriptional regulator [Serratia marcescens]|jgi:AraC-like DNA-binding protein|uniref:AraC family transcriptional regulator n=1 Tax=Serratia marcescens TaxID=615 RepID=UPI0027E3E3E1|nr:AraC family transcriptional regulator [Serratia marcescens]HEJ7172602.1 AraC family transcriptional regulator [Serratia marcescens]
MDPLSEVLAPLNSQNAFFGGLKAGGDWAVHFPAPQGGKFNAVVRGGCWLAAEGLAEPLWLAAGDCLLLTRSLPLTVGSDLSLPALDADALYLQAKNGMASCGEGETCLFIGGRFSFGQEVERLFGSLPVLMVIRGGTEEAAVLQWALQRLADELVRPSPGSTLMTHHLGQIMLTQALRIYLMGEESAASGWLPALFDPRIGAAMLAVHADPARRWTVAALADAASVSRSTLALRFKQKAGMAPLEYVSRWRMLLAARALRTGSEPVSVIAQRLGYDSDSAFSHAFKRMMACSPRDYRRARA